MSTQRTEIEVLTTSGSAPFEDAIEIRVGPMSVTMDRIDAKRVYAELGRTLRASGR